MRRGALWVLLLALAAALPARAEWPRTVTDILGRTVTIGHEPRRILLAEGFQLIALALIDPDPVSRLAGWGGDLEKQDPATYALFKARFPAVAEVPVVGLGSGETFSMEKALAVAPDLAIFSAWQAAATSPEAVAKPFEQAGIPVIFVDFYQSPLTHTAPSLRLLGRALGREAAAEAFIAFSEDRLRRIHDRMADAGPGPRVMLHAYPGLWPCCWSAGSGSLGEVITLLGGRNIGAERFPTPNGGQLDPEYVLAADPEVYIATGLSQFDQPGSISIGSGVEAATARGRLRTVAAEPGLAGLSAMRQGRVHALWNFFNGGPLSIVGIEAMARWIRPELFGDLDPARTLAEINHRFLAVPFTGTYWVSLHP
ncbi:ABC transporter substrate-binding protein [Inquilinus sp. Marseille-Q2685]|uniref:ABC transporter substrate-binding protein n=1 Tax=Inquilinus sp. Marseille-Q2685 TaxID=2866581 RepID=UPI001CE48101|nr:ABC transporter substrate-binding protein [Inquilinus sp. Marseille-Q2685]